MKKKEGNSPAQSIFGKTQTDNVVLQDPLYETPTIPEGQYELPENHLDALKSKHYNTERNYNEYEEEIEEETEEELNEEEKINVINGNSKSPQSMKYFGKNITDEKSQKRFHDEYMSQVIDARNGKSKLYDMQFQKAPKMKNPIYPTSYMTRKVKPMNNREKCPQIMMQFQLQQMVKNLNKSIKLSKTRSSSPNSSIYNDSRNLPSFSPENYKNKYNFKLNNSLSSQTPCPPLDLSIIREQGYIDSSYEEEEEYDGIVSYFDDPFNKLYNSDNSENNQQKPTQKYKNQAKANKPSIVSKYSQKSLLLNYPNRKLPSPKSKFKNSKKDIAKMSKKFELKQQKLNAKKKFPNSKYGNLSVPNSKKIPSKANFPAKNAEMDDLDNTELNLSSDSYEYVSAEDEPIMFDSNGQKLPRTQVKVRKKSKDDALDIPSSLYEYISDENDEIRYDDEGNKLPRRKIKARIYKDSDGEYFLVSDPNEPINYDEYGNKLPRSKIKVRRSPDKNDSAIYETESDPTEDIKYDSNGNRIPRRRVKTRIENGQKIYLIENVDDDGYEYEYQSDQTEDVKYDENGNKLPRKKVKTRVKKKSSAQKFILDYEYEYEYDENEAVQFDSDGNELPRSKILKRVKKFIPVLSQNEYEYVSDENEPIQYDEQGNKLPRKQIKVRTKNPCKIENEYEYVSDENEPIQYDKFGKKIPRTKIKINKSKGDQIYYSYDYVSDENEPIQYDSSGNKIPRKQIKKKVMKIKSNNVDDVYSYEFVSDENEPIEYDSSGKRIPRTQIKKKIIKKKDSKSNTSDYEVDYEYVSDENEPILYDELNQKIPRTKIRKKIIKKKNKSDEYEYVSDENEPIQLDESGNKIPRKKIKRKINKTDDNNLYSYEYVSDENEPILLDEHGQKIPRNKIKKKIFKNKNKSDEYEYVSDENEPILFDESGNKIPRKKIKRKINKTEDDNLYSYEYVSDENEPILLDEHGQKIPRKKIKKKIFKNKNKSDEYEYVSDENEPILFDESGNKIPRKKINRKVHKAEDNDSNSYEYVSDENEPIQFDENGQKILRSKIKKKKEKAKRGKNKDNSYYSEYEYDLNESEYSYYDQNYSYYSDEEGNKKKSKISKSKRNKKSKKLHNNSNEDYSLYSSSDKSSNEYGDDQDVKTRKEKQKSHKLIRMNSSDSFFDYEYISDPEQPVKYDKNGDPIPRQKIRVLVKKKVSDLVNMKSNYHYKYDYEIEYDYDYEFITDDQEPEFDEKGNKIQSKQKRIRKKLKNSKRKKKIKKVFNTDNNKECDFYFEYVSDENEPISYDENNNRIHRKQIRRIVKHRKINSKKVLSDDSQTLTYDSNDYNSDSFEKVNKILKKNKSNQTDPRYKNKKSSTVKRKRLLNDSYLSPTIKDRYNSLLNQDNKDNCRYFSFAGLCQEAYMDKYILNLRNPSRLSQMNSPSPSAHHSPTGGNSPFLNTRRIMKYKT